MSFKGLAATHYHCDRKEEEENLPRKSVLTDVQMHMEICSEMALFQGVIVAFKALILLFICWV